MPTILQKNFQKMKPKLWENIKFGNKWDSYHCFSNSMLHNLISS